MHISNSYNFACVDFLNLKKSLRIREEKTKEITAVSVVLYVIKNHVHLHKLIALIFSA